MVAFHGMLAGPAVSAGIKLPEDLENYNTEEYPHWEVYCLLQLCRPLPYPAAHWDNAKIIASIPDDKIKKVTIAELVTFGFQ
jgi:hypothetical protein